MERQLVEHRGVPSDLEPCGTVVGPHAVACRFLHVKRSRHRAHRNVGHDGGRAHEEHHASQFLHRPVILGHAAELDGHQGHLGSLGGQRRREGRERRVVGCLGQRVKRNCCGVAGPGAGTWFRYVGSSSSAERYGESEKVVEPSVPVEQVDPLATFTGLLHYQPGWFLYTHHLHPREHAMGSQCQNDDIRDQPRNDRVSAARWQHDNASSKMLLGFCLPEHNGALFDVVLGVLLIFGFTLACNGRASEHTRTQEVHCAQVGLHAGRLVVGSNWKAHSSIVDIMV
ncbi:MAG: hypothetical protein KVP17_003232 [Porospora cf. gigantea B]|uniref:uncharacterized protein n=1 Tax=Porospora cf. gigantea B TaxID=2853592 RepID=UPI003571BF0F|nr:MAG: hypothetical protein KVP17_003232 [Porospora cf. gigantea B]